MSTVSCTTACSSGGEVVGLAAFHAMAARTIAMVQHAKISERDALVHELFRRHEELMVTSVKASTLAEAMGLGFRIIERLQPPPRSLNMTASDEGDVLFSLFGPGGREAELWLGETPGSYTFVLIEDGETKDGELPSTEFEPIAAWLAGGARSV